MTSQCEHGSLAQSCALCEANTEIAALRNDINSEYNACMFRDHCRSMEAEIAALRVEIDRIRMTQTAPSIFSAEQIGTSGPEAMGIPHDEAERIAFEAWMRGHFWEIGAEWNGGQYVSKDVGPPLDPNAILTRMLWAAWRDRAALSKIGAFDFGGAA